MKKLLLWIGSIVFGVACLILLLFYALAWWYTKPFPFRPEISSISLTLPPIPPASPKLLSILQNDSRETHPTSQALFQAQSLLWKQSGAFLAAVAAIPAQQRQTRAALLSALERETLAPGCWPLPPPTDFAAPSSFFETVPIPGSSASPPPPSPARSASRPSSSPTSSAQAPGQRQPGAWGRSPSSSPASSAQAKPLDFYSLWQTRFRELVLLRLFELHRDPEALASWLLRWEERLFRFEQTCPLGLTALFGLSRDVELLHSLWIFPLLSSKLRPETQAAIAQRLLRWSRRSPTPLASAFRIEHHQHTIPYLRSLFQPKDAPLGHHLDKRLSTQIHEQLARLQIAKVSQIETPARLEETTPEETFLQERSRDSFLALLTRRNSYGYVLLGVAGPGLTTWHIRWLHQRCFAEKRLLAWSSHLGRAFQYSPLCQGQAAQDYLARYSFLRPAPFPSASPL